MSEWWESKMVGFDVETTGVDVDTARIVSASVLVVGPGLEPEQFSIIVDPGVEIPAEAAAIHGITTERARAEGVPAREAIPALLVALAAPPPEYARVAYNAQYDFTVADREARRYDCLPLQEETELLVVDPRVLDAHLHRFRKGKRTLEAAVRSYAFGHETPLTADAQQRMAALAAHEAGSDALAACRMAWLIGKAGRVIRNPRDMDEERELTELREEWEAVRHDLRKLHDAQVRWWRWKQLDIADYFERKVGDAEKARRARESVDWPVIPVGALSAPEPVQLSMEEVFGQ